MQKNTIGYAAIAGILLLGGIIALAVHISGGDHLAPAATTQPDTRPVALTVGPGGTGVSSPEAAAALQSQSSQSATLGASTGTQSSLMGQPNPGLQAAGGGNIRDLLR